jgi:glutathione S-transferase
MKFHYFDGYGKGEGIRILLSTAKAEYTEERYSQETWKVAKESGKFEFGQVPALEKDGHVFTQSSSILRFLGKTYGYYSEDYATAWKIDSLVDAVSDIQNAFYKFSWEQDQDKKKAGLDNYLANVLPAWFNAIEKRIAANENKHHLVGDKLTIADFAFAGWAFGSVLNENHANKTELQAVLANYPLVKEYLHHLGDHHLKEYLAGRPQRPY